MRTRLAIVSALAALPLLLAGPAAADCAAAPSPSPSRHTFVGTVVDVDDQGRVATVVRDDGRHVVVDGSGVPSSWLEGVLGNGLSSVDRTFVLTGRYEFHPADARPPFHDNGCTATRQLAGPRPTGAVPTAADRLPAWLPVDEQAGRVGYVPVVVTGLAAVALAVALARGVRRWRRA